MKKKSAKKEYEREILRRMAEDGAEEAPEQDGAETGETEEEDAGKEEYIDERDSRKCPRCLKEVGKANVCPHCGYNGYIPMSKRSIMKTRLILWPIVLVIAVIIFIIVRNK
ncbi:MAG: hypothetical protein J5760_06810 [Clostridia bacterium]|nr:hypothetical protein [Clostridia bacterium]